MSDQHDRNIWEVVGVPCSVIASSPTHTDEFPILETRQDLGRIKSQSSTEASIDKNSQANKAVAFGSFNGSDEEFNLFMKNGANTYDSERDRISYAVAEKHVRTHNNRMNPTKDTCCCNGQREPANQVPVLRPEDVGIVENGLEEHETKKCKEAPDAGAACGIGQSSSQDRSLFDHIRDSFTLSRKDDLPVTTTNANESAVTPTREEVAAICSSDDVPCSDAAPSTTTRCSQAQGLTVSDNAMTYVEIVPMEALSKPTQCHRQFPFTQRLKKLSLDSQQKFGYQQEPIAANSRPNSVGVISASPPCKSSEQVTLNRINGAEPLDSAHCPTTSPADAAASIPTTVLTSHSPSVPVFQRNGHSSNLTDQPVQQNNINGIRHCSASNSFDTDPARTSINSNSPVTTVLTRINIPPVVDVSVPLTTVVHVTPTGRLSASPGLQFSAEPNSQPGSHSSATLASVGVNRTTAFDLSCRESIVPSPELLQRNFRPVSSPLEPVTGVSQCGAVVSSGQSPVANRGSVLEEMSITSSMHMQLQEDLAGECALSESAHKNLRCDSPAPYEVSCSSEEQSSSSHNSVVKSVTAFTCDPDMDEDRSACESSSSELSDITLENLKDSSSHDGEQLSKKNDKSNTTAMVRRLEPKLPSPSREASGGDLYRDPSQLTREERALQRAMMRFSEMEMKEKKLAVDRVVKRTRRRKLRNHLKKKPQVVGMRKESGTSTWFKTFKQKRLWISQPPKVIQKAPSRQDASNGHRLTNGVRKNIFMSSTKSVPASKEESKKRPKIPEDDSKDGGHTKLVQREKKVRGSVKDEAAPSTELVTKRRRLSHDAGMSSVKAAKRARSDSAPGSTQEQETKEKCSSAQAKANRSHRVKTYLLVAAYQGFKDFKPVVLQSRTRRKSKATDNCKEEDDISMVKPPVEPQFPLLVVESVKSKPIKEMVIAENAQVQELVENCLKARGKWRHLDSKQDHTDDMEDLENMKEAKKLTVNRTTGETILHKAARLGYHETVHSYITQGADPGAKDNAGWTPLHEACSRGKLGVAKVLTKFGADANACSNDGIRPMHDAAEGGHVDVLRLLLSYGADPMLATYSGHTALHCAKDLRTSKFLTGYLEDVDLVNSLHPKTLDENPWEFTGSSAVMDDKLNPDHVAGILDAVPESASVCDGEFELSDRPHLPSYNLPVVNDDVIVSRRNYVLLQDVLDHLNVSRAVLARKIKKLEIREMPWSEFLGEVYSSQMCVRPKFVPADCSTGEATAELLPINYNLRRVLGIRVESVGIR